MADEPRALCGARATIDKQVWTCSLDANHREELHLSYGVGWRGDRRPHEVRWSDPRPSEVEFSPEAVEAAYARATTHTPARVRGGR